MPSTATKAVAGKPRGWGGGRDLLADHSLQWGHQVSQLTVQNKLLEVTPLQQSTQMWNVRCLVYLRQLSFLARASINCLSTPTSLARWRMKVSPSCPLRMPTSSLYNKTCPQLLQNSTEPRTIHLETRQHPADHCRVHQAPEGRYFCLL